MKNRVNVYGVILPSAWDYDREFFSEFSATFPVQVAEALAAADKSKDLELYIDSPGGYIDAGRSMISMIEDWCAQNGRQCHVTVGGMAASMAAVMMVAFKGRVTVHECSMVMFHAAKTAIWDDATAEELRDTASALEAFNTYAAKMIARRTGLSESEAAALIAGRKESFFGATDLIEANLADAIQGEAAEPIRQPSARAIRACSKQFSAHAHDVGGLLAAVAVSAAVGQTQGGPIMAKKNKSKASADAPAPEAVVVEQAEETAEAVNDSAAQVDDAPVDDPPAEEAKAAETAEDPAPVEEQEAAAEETTVEESEESEEESEEPAAEPQESEDVKALRAELAQAKAALNAAEARAKAAEAALSSAKMTVVTAALTPAPERPVLQEPPAVAWRKAVRACGDNIAVAKAKHPELYAALTK
jgi:ATP-dependent protease ClpP protease subunit